MEQALINACKNNQLSVVRLLVTKKLDLNYRDNFGKTALVYAGLKGNIDIIRLLVDAGADASICDDFSNSLLHHVVVSGNKEAIKNVLKLGCIDINARNMDGSTALLMAVDKFDKNGVEILLRHGAKDIANNKNQTALELASKNGASSIVELLLVADELVEKENASKQNQIAQKRESFVAIKCTECLAFLDLDELNSNRGECRYCNTKYEKR